MYVLQRQRTSCVRVACYAWKNAVASTEVGGHLPRSGPGGQALYLYCCRTTYLCDMNILHNQGIVCTSFAGTYAKQSCFFELLDLLCDKVPGKSGQHTGHILQEKKSLV